MEDVDMYGKDENVDEEDGDVEAGQEDGHGDDENA